MTNKSDILLSKLESIPWRYSISCQIYGKEESLLLKYSVEDDYYAVMISDMNLTYFECLSGDDIDEHYKRFNRGEIKREKLLKHIESILNDVTKTDDWTFNRLTVDCHTSRLTLKISKPISLLKFEWSFYMISTNPETFKLHVTDPLLRLASSLRDGVEELVKVIKKKDKQLEQLDASNADNQLSSVQFFINKIIPSLSHSSHTDTQINSQTISKLFSDDIISALLTQKSSNMRADNDQQTTGDGVQTANKKNEHKNNSNEDELTKRQEFESRLNTEERSTRSKKAKIKL